jgi:propionate CoA-transferase
VRVEVNATGATALDARKVTAPRRDATEHQLVVNLGIGIPEGIATVAGEERTLGVIRLTAEAAQSAACPRAA